MDKKSVSVPATTRVKKPVRLCSIDPGVELNRRQRREVREFTASGRRPHAGMPFIAGANRFRESWDEGTFGPNGRWPMRLHKTPAGTYFWLVIGNLSGAYLQQDGSRRAFCGPFMAPIYCVSCGRADRSRDRLCVKQHRVPLRLLRKLEIAEPTKYEARIRALSAPPNAAESTSAASIHAAVVRDGGWAGRMAVKGPAKSTPRKAPGPIERAFGVVLTFVWNRVKFLAILTLLGIAAGGH